MVLIETIEKAVILNATNGIPIIYGLLPRDSIIQWAAITFLISIYGAIAGCVVIHAIWKTDSRGQQISGSNLLTVNVLHASGQLRHQHAHYRLYGHPAERLRPEPTGRVLHRPPT
ncbi:hypothetical protein RvY_16608 [Ramazzottius varieornatus]|uniref:Uncharacterized protein n=1 Tax=Ramazzottius varieornatus TaxID=947166 RepID=A0A1D1VZ32_RAMVA|nr:hypothetical protein RvY_16608 [Ramazzottius varieornatus]